jgi:hypothetical protein
MKSAQDGGAKNSLIRVAFMYLVQATLKIPREVRILAYFWSMIQIGSGIYG